MPRIGETKKPSPLNASAKPSSVLPKPSSLGIGGKSRPSEKTSSSESTKGGKLPLWLDVTSFPNSDEGKWTILRIMLATGGGACSSVLWGTVETGLAKKLVEAFETMGWNVTRRTVHSGHTGNPPTREGEAERIQQLDRLLKFLGSP